MLKDLINRKAAKPVDYLVHVQGRTSEDEHMDFAVSLFSKESQGKWEEKLATAQSLIGKRREYNNNIMIERHKSALRQAQEEKKLVQEAPNVVELKK